MKISLKLQDDQDVQHHHNPLVKAKIPITIFNQPFTSSIATTSIPTNASSHLLFSLSSNFSSGPSVKLSYSHTTPSPFSLSLKSGLGLFGSPNHSPLVFTAQFSLSHTNPTFFLHVKPQLGDFSLKQTTFSDPNPKPVSGSGSIGSARLDLDSGSGSNGGLVDGFVSEGSSVWQELKLEPLGGKDGLGSVEDEQLGSRNGGKDRFLSGIAVMARTVLPVTKRLMVNMQWGVNFPAKLGTKLPYLTVKKIGIERVEEGNEEKEKNGESNVGDLELLKGMCFWMKRDLEVLEKENKEMKHRLEVMKLGVSKKHFHGESDASGERVLPPLSETSSGFEKWRNRNGAREENVKTEFQTPVKSGREESVRIEPKKSSNQANDLESELQKAIKAATA